MLCLLGGLSFKFVLFCYSNLVEIKLTVKTFLFIWIYAELLPERRMLGLGCCYGCNIKLPQY